MGMHRREGRILAMQALCQGDVQDDRSPDSLRSFLDTPDSFLEVPDVAPAARRYGEKLVRAFWERSEDVDTMIGDVAQHWSLERMSPVDRNVVRVAVVELLITEVPPAVVLNEAIEIGREFGGADTPRFVNGVLDAIQKRLEKQDS